PAPLLDPALVCAALNSYILRIAGPLADVLVRVVPELPGVDPSHVGVTQGGGHNLLRGLERVSQHQVTERLHRPAPSLGKVGVRSACAFELHHVVKLQLMCPWNRILWGRLPALRLRRSGRELITELITELILG